MKAPRQDTASDPLTIGLLGVAGLAVATAALLWGAALATLVITGEPTTDVSFADSPGFVLELLRTGDVQTAWTDAYPRAGDPSAWVFWTNLVILLVLIALVAYLVLRARGGQARRTRSDPATWAKARDERRIAVRRSPGDRHGRLVAGRGRASRRLLAGDDCVSAVVFGPNGSGKTTSLIVPNTLDWHGPAVLTTTKPQDLEPVCTARADHGPVWVIAPGGAPGHDTVGWSPVEAAYDAERADRLAEWLVESSGMSGDPKARPWNAQARKYLKGLLLAAHLSGGGLGQWISWIHAGERARDTVEDILRSAGHEDAAREYGSTWQIHEEGKGSVLFTALGLADTYSRPGVFDAAERGGFTPEALLDSGGTLCIVTPSSEGDRFAPYFTALLSSVLHEAEVRAAATSGPLDPRLLLALDEAGNVFRYPRLPHLLTTARGNGIQLMLIYHDLAQVEHLYGGREVARTVVSNAKLRMLLPGVGDLETLRYWSELIGHTRTHTHGTSTGAGGHRTRSRNEHTDKLAPVHRLQQMPEGDAVLLYQNLPPARVRLLPWFRDRRFHHLRGAA